MINLDKTELSKTIRKYIKNKETELNRTCRRVWEFTNPKGECYLFGSFCRDYKRMVLPVGYLEPRLNRFVSVK